MHPRGEYFVDRLKGMHVTAAFAKPSDFAKRSAAERAVAVGYGTRVTVGRGILVTELWIVGEEWPEEGGHRVDPDSPPGRALMGARVGETVEYHSGGRIEEIRVLAVSPA